MSLTLKLSKLSKFIKKKYTYSQDICTHICIINKRNSVELK